MSVILFLAALSIMIVSVFNYKVNIGSKYYPISKASSLLYDVGDAHTKEEKAWYIREATRLCLQEAQTNDKPLLIELRSLTPENTSEQFHKVSILLNDEYEERALGPYTIPAGIMMFTVVGGGYLALGKYKDWRSKERKTFAFTLVGTLEFCLLLFVIL